MLLGSQLKKGVSKKIELSGNEPTIWMLDIIGNIVRMSCEAIILGIMLKPRMKNISKWIHAS